MSLVIEKRGRGSPEPRLAWSPSAVTRPGPPRPACRGPGPGWTVCSRPRASETRSLRECGAQAACRAGPNSPPRRCRSSPPRDTSVCPVLSLFVLLILLLVGTLGAEPLHFLRRRSHYSDTGPTRGQGEKRFWINRLYVYILSLCVPVILIK